MASHEPIPQFESRKRDHIELSLSAANQAEGLSGLDRVDLIHEALPDLNFDQILIQSRSLDLKLKTPFLVSSMTAGHGDSSRLNTILARAAESRGWKMGVGSQRRELGDKAAAQEWKQLRKAAPKVHLLGNLGLAQLIRTKISDVERLVDSLEASAMIIHLNALQECMQPEGTPQFKGGVKALKDLAKKLSVPVVVKETGCGISKSTLKRLKGLGLAAVDVSGLGGTHWGRIEGGRGSNDLLKSASATFANWGIATVDCVAAACTMKKDFEVWASGGVRTGLDAAKLLAMGATTVGFAQPILEAALKGEGELDQRMALIEFELKTALFCTGASDLTRLQQKKVWQWRST